MTKRPSLNDHRIILAYSGRIAVGLGIMCVFPLLVAVLEGEWVSFVDFIIGASVCLLVGEGLTLLMPRDARPTWLHGMVATAFSWLLVVVLAAIPYGLSGHYASFLDCVFDTMSGFTT